MQPTRSTAFAKFRTATPPLSMIVQPGVAVGVAEVDAPSNTMYVTRLRRSLATHKEPTRKRHQQLQQRSHLSKSWLYRKRAGSGATDAAAAASSARASACATYTLRVSNLLHFPMACHSNICS